MGDSPLERKGLPLSYLRFTPLEYRALCQLCRPLDLADDFFPNFKNFLVTALRDDLPELANRIAQFRRGQLRILFDHVRRPKAKPPSGLSQEEFRALSQACNSLVNPHRFLHYYKDSLIRHFQKSKPDLARKLTRMTDQQFQELYGRVKERRRKG